MSRGRVVGLVAWREVRERLRNRVVLGSTLMTVVVAVVIVVVAGLAEDGGPSEYEVGVVGDEAASVAEVAEVREDAFDVELELQSFDDEAAAEAALEDEEIDAALIGDREALAGADPPDDLVSLLSLASRDVRSTEALREEGLSEAEIGAALDPEPLEVAAIAESDGGGEGLALASGLLLYLAIIFAGLAVATGVVEEKGSRVIELLLSAIRPVQLLIGKVIGIGVVGLLQVAAFAVTGIVAAMVIGDVSLPESTAQTAILAGVFFLLGYVVYACAFAVAGAIVSRQEDVQGSSSVLTFVLVGAYLASIGSIGQPASTFAVVTSILPPTAPMVIPVRAAQDALQWWEIAVSIALLIVAAAALLWLAARVYNRAALHTGAPMKLREALRRG